MYKDLEAQKIPVGPVALDIAPPDGEEFILHTHIPRPAAPTETEVEATKKATVRLAEKPLNEYKVNAFFTKCYPRLFPRGKGDPLLKSRQVPVPLAAAAKYLTQFAYYDEKRKRWVWPYAQHGNFQFHIHDMLLRHKANKQAETFMKLNKEVKDLSLEDMQEKDDKWFEEKIKRFTKTTIGSDGYWKYSIRNKFTALIEQEGAFTIFYTMSCADQQWRDWREAFGAEDLNNWEYLKLLRSCTGAVAQLYNLRQRGLRKAFCSSYEAKYWAERDESANRGAPHTHGSIQMRSDPGLCALSKTAAAGLIAVRKLAGLSFLKGDEVEWRKPNSSSDNGFDIVPGKFTVVECSNSQTVNDGKAAALIEDETGEQHEVRRIQLNPTGMASITEKIRDGNYAQSVVAEYANKLAYAVDPLSPEEEEKYEKPDEHPCRRALPRDGPTRNLEEWDKFYTDVVHSCHWHIHTKYCLDWTPKEKRFTCRFAERMEEHVLKDPKEDPRGGEIEKREVVPPEGAKDATEVRFPEHRTREYIAKWNEDLQEFEVSDRPLADAYVDYATLEFHRKKSGKWDSLLRVPRNDSRVNNHSRLLSLYGQCNTDQAIMTSTEKAVKYVTKYITKSEKWTDAAKTIFGQMRKEQLELSCDRSEFQNKLTTIRRSMIGLTSGRDRGLQEVNCRLLQLQVARFSHKFVMHRGGEEKL